MAHRSSLVFVAAMLLGCSGAQPHRAGDAARTQAHSDPSVARGSAVIAAVIRGTHRSPVAVIACKDGKVAWSQSTKDFGRRPVKGTPLDQWSLAYDFFEKGNVSQTPETVSADAWVPNARDGEEVVEHVFPMPNYGVALSLLWFPAK